MRNVEEVLARFESRHAGAAPKAAKEPKPIHPESLYNESKIGFLAPVSPKYFEERSGRGIGFLAAI